MKKQWMNGTGIKTRFGPKGDIKDSEFYPVDESGNVDWDTVGKIKDNPKIPTYNDILKEMDIKPDVILVYKDFGPSYSSLLHLYAIKRSLNFGSLMASMNPTTTLEEPISEE